MSDLPSFDEFLRTLTGREPLPWQSRLAAQVDERGWPDVIGVPTGLGKSTCIDIATWAIARDSERPTVERRHATRVWYVVNRRLLVDEAADRADQLARLLNDPDGITEADLGSGSDLSAARQVLTACAAALRHRSKVHGSDGPLHASRLHGAYDQTVLPISPGQPAILASTVPMFGSRLLFRGYGTGRYTRSIEAALAGTDALVLLDEAHLSGPLLELIPRLVSADHGIERVLNEQRLHPQLVQLTATAIDNPGAERFDLDEADYGNPVVRARLQAKKPTSVDSTDKKSIATVLAKRAVELASGATTPQAIAVFVNSPARARSVFAAVQKEVGKKDTAPRVTMLTGRMRSFDSAKVRSELLDHQTGLRSGRRRSNLDRSWIVIATQTLEVGADLDFDGLVTETAGVRSLVQRFGRLNRLGAITTAHGVIVHVSDDPTTGLYGNEPTEVWGRLSDLDESELDLGPERIAQVLGPPSDIGPYAPQLLPNHLDEYAKTTLAPVGEAPVSLFIDGMADLPDTAVQVAWRAVLPSSGDGSVTADLVPPLNDGEIVEAPISEARSFLDALDPSLTAWRVCSDRVSIQPISPDEIRPGDQLIVPTSAGGYDSTLGWTGATNTSRNKPPKDLSWVGGSLLLRPEPVRAWLSTVLESHPDGTVVSDAVGALLTLASTRSPKPLSERFDACLAPDDRESPIRESLAAMIRDAFSEWVSELERWVAEDDDDSEDLRWTRSIATSLTQILVGLIRDVLDAGTDPAATAAPAAFLSWRSESAGWVTDSPRARRFSWSAPTTDSADGLSDTGNGDHLAVHLTLVGDRANQIALDLGLPTDLVTAVRNAGRLHDLGKADPRFQRWLTDAEGPLLAKSASEPASWSAARQRSGWPAGGRHELLSVQIALILADEHGLALLEPDRDLVLHLVASHHGRGRPGLFGVDDPVGSSASLTGDLLDATGVTGHSIDVRLNLGIHDWDQPTRFQALNERYGRRGLALLETVLRQADWIESAISARGTAEAEQGERG